MRIADTVIHPRMRIIIYALEKHFYVEFEAGPMKQGFRFSKEQMNGVNGVKALLNDGFVAEVENRFGEMYRQAKAATEQL
jgi:hypothetical protein